MSWGQATPEDSCETHVVVAGKHANLLVVPAEEHVHAPRRHVHDRRRVADRDMLGLARLSVHDRQPAPRVPCAPQRVRVQSLADDAAADAGL